MTVVAHHDSIALLHGKTFPSEAGGTWGRGHAMLEELGKTLTFVKTNEGPLQQHTALDGRVTFLLVENPGKAELHDQLLNNNGCLRALHTGTFAVAEGCRFFGDPVYRHLIREQ